MFHILRRNIETFWTWVVKTQTTLVTYANVVLTCKNAFETKISHTSELNDQIRRRRPIRSVHVKMIYKVARTHLIPRCFLCKSLNFCFSFCLDTFCIHLLWHRSKGRTSRAHGGKQHSNLNNKVAVPFKALNLNCGTLLPHASPMCLSFPDNPWKRNIITLILLFSSRNKYGGFISLDQLFTRNSTATKYLLMYYPPIVKKWKHTYNTQFKRYIF